MEKSSEDETMRVTERDPKVNLAVGVVEDRNGGMSVVVIPVGISKEGVVGLVGEMDEDSGGLQVMQITKEAPFGNRNDFHGMVFSYPVNK